MITIYVVEHLYDTDGGFGDAIQCSEVLAAFLSPNMAERFIEQANTLLPPGTVTDTPHDDLTAGDLVIIAKNLYCADFPDVSVLDGTVFGIYAQLFGKSCRLRKETNHDRT